MNTQECREIKSTTWCFQLGDDPELIHIIKTRFKDLYMVVHEDAYQFDLGRVEMGTKNEIEVKYKIELK